MAWTAQVITSSFHYRWSLLICLCPVWTVMKLMGYTKCLNKNLWVYFLDQYVIIMFLLSDVLLSVWYVLLSVWYVLLSVWYMCCLFSGSTVDSTACYYWCQHNVCLVPCCVEWHSSCYVVQLYACIHCCVGHFSYVYILHTHCCVGRHSSCVMWYSCTRVNCCVGHFSYVAWYMCTYTLLCWTTFQLCYVVQQYIAALENVLIVLCESHVANECCPILFSSKECSSTKSHTKSVVSNEPCWCSVSLSWWPCSCQGTGHLARMCVNMCRPWVVCASKPSNVLSIWSCDVCRTSHVIGKLTNSKFTRWTLRGEPVLWSSFAIVKRHVTSAWTWLVPHTPPSQDSF